MNDSLEQIAFAQEYNIGTAIRNPSSNVSSGNSVGIADPVGSSVSSPSYAGGISTPNTVINSSGTGSLNNISLGGQKISISTSAQLQPALDALAVTGGTLYLASGTYIVTTALKGYGSVQIVGVSPSQTIIDFNHTSANLSFSGTNLYTTGTITAISGGVNVTGSGTSWVSQMAGRALFIGTRWYTIASVTDSTHLVLAESYGDNVTLPVSCRIASVLKDFLVSNVTLKNSTGTALVVTDCRQYNLVGVECLTNNVGYSATNVSEQSINELLSIANTSNGVQWTNLGISQIASLNTIGNGGNGLTANNIKTVDINPLAADSNTGDGVNITTGVNVLILSETVGNTGKGIQLVSGCDNIDIANGTIQNNGSDGIKFTATCTNCHVYSSSITGNGGYGANVAASTDQNVIFTTNNFATNTSGAINDAGTTTLIRGNTGATDNTTSSLSSLGLFGAGTDGSAVISTNTTLTSDKYYIDLTINSGVTLQTGGYRIFVNGTLTNNGTISNNGGNGGNSPGAGSTTAGIAGVAAPGVTLPAGKSGKIGAAGISATVLPTFSGGNPGIAGDTANPSLGVSGTAGGAGGDDSFGDVGGIAGTAGVATGETLSESIPAFSSSGTISAGVEKTLSQVMTPSGSSSGTTLSNSAGSGSGASGAAGTSNSVGSGISSGGGGSGASGGFILIIAKIIVISATGLISANGGNGGNAGQGTTSLNGRIGGSGGGGGGSGGVIFLGYTSLTNNGSISVSGGTGGGASGGSGGGGSGTAGTAGLTGNVYKVRLTTT